MLNYVAQLILSYLVYGPWRDPQGFNFPQSEPLAPEALYPILVAGTRLNAGVFIALAAVAVGWVVMKRSFLGFQLKVSGLAEPAARYAGFSATRAIWVGMLAGGLVAGIAGVGEVAGPLGQLFPTASPGYGYALAWRPERAFPQSLRSWRSRFRPIKLPQVSRLQSSEPV
jgi:general nucleoside transport system permease protein